MVQVLIIHKVVVIIHTVVDTVVLVVLVDKVDTVDEVDKLCDGVANLHEGRLCFEGGVDAMRSETGESFLDKAFLKLIRPKTEETQ